ncbi:hypothetical protein KY284_013054 [Solanum tuberosum]|nr:hypothetical protein KY284_013054 [Solanum tuberosum]
MESKRNGASNLPPKRKNTHKSAQLPSTSVKDSIFNRIPVLPEELVTQILLRLPVKSLLKFRSVSKSWLGLISNPEFINTHLSKSANNKDFTHHRFMLSFCLPKYNLKDCSASSLLYDSVAEALDLEYPTKEIRRSVEIVGSVNGLICLVIAKKYFLIWNPSIRKFKKLPECRDELCFGHHSMYGFVYDEVHGDYKVVAGFNNEGYGYSFLVKVKMYSLNSDSWTSLEDFESGVLGTKSGVFVNGKLHWANSVYRRSGWDIISVDLADRTWGEVEQPYYGEGDFGWTLGVLGTDLSVFSNYRRIQADVWVLKEYGVKESWIKMFTIDIPCDPRMGYKFCQFFCMSNKGEVLFHFGSTFMIYNAKDHSITHRSPHLEVTGYDYEASIYIESLVWPFFQRKESRMQQRRRLK